MKSKRVKIKIEKGVPISPELIEESRIRIKKEMKNFLRNLRKKRHEK